MQPPFFSIIMNVYNGQTYIKDAIDSIFAQTCTDWELIIWDDQSTDDSARVIRKFDDPRIKYFYAPCKTNIGPAREHAIRKAEGQWLAFLDQDDIWEPWKLERQKQLIDQDESDRLGIVYGMTIKFFTTGATCNFDRWHTGQSAPKGDIFLELVKKPSFIALSACLLRRSAVIEILGIPAYVRYCPDYYLFVMVARQYHAAYLNEVCCRYRVHDSNMSHSIKSDAHREILDIISSCSDRISPELLKTRKKIHNTLIGIDELFFLGDWAKGVKRILIHGSLWYIFLRPFVKAIRFLHRIKT